MAVCNFGVIQGASLSLQVIILLGTYLEMRHTKTSVNTHFIYVEVEKQTISVGTRDFISYIINFCRFEITYFTFVCSGTGKTEIMLCLEWESSDGKTPESVKRLY